MDQYQEKPPQTGIKFWPHTKRKYDHLICSIDEGKYHWIRNKPKERNKIVKTLFWAVKSQVKEAEINNAKEYVR